MSVLAGVRVLDASRGLAGSLAGMMLADFGAHVLRLDPPDAPDDGDVPGALMWGRGKTRLTLDVDTAADRARLDDLLTQTDIAIFDQGPTRLAALGLTADVLTARLPSLIHLWTPPFGVSGAWSDLPEHHAMLTGLTGTAFRQGSYADQPIWHVMPMVLHGQGVMAAAAAAAALRERERTGRGQGVVVSGAHGNAEIAGPVGLLDAPGMMQGHPLGGSPSYRLYECADGQWLFLGTLFPHFFERAIDAMDLRARVAEAPPNVDVGRFIEEVFRERPRQDWLTLLAAHDVPVAPVADRADWLDAEPMVDFGMRLERDHPTLGRVRMPGLPLKLTETPGRPGELARAATAEDLTAFVEPRPRPPGAEPGAALRPPLAGVKVLDLGTVIAGAYAGSILANFGADVIKIEGKEGDPFRPFGPGFTNHNRGKRGLGLDLKAPEGREAFLDMARTADVVLDNYRLGVRARLGIDYAALAQVNPRIISLSINAYGSTGREAKLPGFDPLLQARSGMMGSQGGTGDEPVFHSVPINDVATAAVSAYGVILALLAREQTGRGQNIETCLAAQSALFQSPALTTWPGAPRPWEGERDCIGVHALNRYYPCADGWLTLAATTPAQAAGVAAALGAPDWPVRFGDLLSQPRRGDLAFEIAERLRHRPRAEILAVLAAYGVPVAPVFTTEEARGEAWLWESGFFDVQAHPMWGEVVMSRGYAEFDGGGGRFDRRDPRLGEHGVEVLLESGFDFDRIRALAQAQVIFRG